MLLHYFKKPVLTLSELDKITGHSDSAKFTWLSKTLLWLSEDLGFEVINVENLNYNKFAKEGELYLKEIWDAETFSIQNKFSDLKLEQEFASKLMSSKVRCIDGRWTLSKIDQFRSAGYFTMLSINPFVLMDRPEYGSHLIVLGEKVGDRYKIYDPDLKEPRFVKAEILAKAISKSRKPDFNVIFVKDSLS